MNSNTSRRTPELELDKIRKKKIEREKEKEKILSVFTKLGITKPFVFLTYKGFFPILICADVRDRIFANTQEIILSRNLHVSSEVSFIFFK